jgi:DNA-binding transcriptional ArsR family regulator
LKSDLLAVFKALSDEKRLKILKLIAFNEQLANGKIIAERLTLSSSVVSRHLAQLRGCGLINEHSPDNRNITYSLDMEKISAISKDLQTFIKD